MLVLSRKRDEKIIIGDNITIMIVEVRGETVRLGIEAPREVPVHRMEVYESIQQEGEHRKQCSSVRQENTPPASEKQPNQSSI